MASAAFHSTKCIRCFETTLCGFFSGYYLLQKALTAFPSIHPDSFGDSGRQLEPKRYPWDLNPLGNLVVMDAEQDSIASRFVYVQTSQ